MYKTITYLSQSRLTAEMHASVARAIMTHVEPHREDPFVMRQITALEAILVELNAAFQRILKNNKTLTINELDLLRDKVLIALRSALQAAIDQSVLNERKAEAAQTVMTLLNKMGADVIRIPMLEESAVITAFIAAVYELDADTFTLSGVKPLMEKLVEVQEQFTAVYNERTAEEEIVEEPRQIREIRKDISFRLNALLTYVGTNGVDLEEEYRNTVADINTLIADVMAKAKADQTRKENAETTN